MSDKELDKLETELAETDDFAEVPPSDIVAYNELRSCADLKRMYDNKQLNIQPDFQRDIVWSNPEQTRFIDSLIKQLPIPSMCISLDYKTNERLVIDGLQRINSIITFLSNEEWKLSDLEDIDSKISGKTVGYIKQKYSEIYDRVENLTIPITVLRCDYSKKAHLNYLFTIFHRLNTGGNKLNNQEIRNCIYNGRFNDFLKSSVKYANFVSLMNIKEDRTYRFAFEEMVLRFFAFYDSHLAYNGRLAKFLNDYMNDNRHPSEESIAQKRHLFERTIDLIYLRLFNSHPLPDYSKALTEGLLLGIAKNIETLENQGQNEVQVKLQNLLQDENFSVDNLKEGLSKREKVISRLNSAIEIFAA
jgi:hypothetical protein